MPRDRFKLIKKYFHVCDNRWADVCLLRPSFLQNGQPIRFDFKYWDLCSSDGYLYSFIPYSGTNENRKPEYTNCGLNELVVVKLLKLLEDPRKHCVAFDNFFTSHKLMCQLPSLGYYTTLAIRDNRTNNAKLIDALSSKKKERGWLDYTFYGNNNVLIGQWNENFVVTIASNHGGKD